MLIIPMLPAELFNGGASLNIQYCFTETVFGKIIMASTPKGLCYVAFEDDEQKAISNLKSKFPNASYTALCNDYHQQVLHFFGNNWDLKAPITFHVKATVFQIEIWNALLQIPLGKLSTYGAIAESIGKPMASRAVGTAIGSNPIAFLIPCHRVVQATGKMGGYMWGTQRKKMIIDWESNQGELF